MVQINEDWIFNWRSGQAVPRSGRIGQILEEIEGASRQIADYAISQPPEFTYDMRRGTVIPVSSPDSLVIKAAWDNFYDLPSRPAGKVMNEETGKFVKAAGKRGSEIIGSKWSCLQYGERDIQFKPLEHQVTVASFYSDPRVFGYNRGGLLYWGLGSGKTCGSIWILDQIIKTVGSVDKIFVFTTGSLRENFISEYCIKCGLNPELIHTKFRFITYNYNEVLRILPPVHQMKNSIIIIDEVHILLHGRANGTESYTEIYRRLKRVKRTRFILLSGTPIVSKTRELYFLIKLLKPWAFKQRRFEEYYYDDKVPTPDLIPLVSDIISYYVPTVDDKGINVYPDVSKTLFPITMTSRQNYEYELARGKEVEYLYPPNKDLKQIDPQLYKRKSAIYFLKISMKRSRQRTNMIYPDHLQSQLNDYERRSGVPPDKLVKDGGWINENFINNLAHYSPKFYAVIDSIQRNSGKHVVYSEFKNRYGIYALSAILKHYKISHLTFTGDLKSDEKRREVSDQFNSEENRFGDIKKVLLITEAGGLGQSFFHVRYMYIMEQSISEYKIKQAMGRVVRYKSHHQLDPEDRTVEIFRLFAVTPATVLSEDDQGNLVEEEYNEPDEFTPEDIEEELVPQFRKTSDFFAYDKGQTKEQAIFSTIEMLESNLGYAPQIDCEEEFIEEISDEDLEDDDPSFKEDDDEEIAYHYEGKEETNDPDVNLDLGDDGEPPPDTSDIASSNINDLPPLPPQPENEDIVAERASLLGTLPPAPFRRIRREAVPVEPFEAPVQPEPVKAIVPTRRAVVPVRPIKAPVPARQVKPVKVPVPVRRAAAAPSPIKQVLVPPVSRSVPPVSRSAPPRSALPPPLPQRSAPPVSRFTQLPQRSTLPPPPRTGSSRPLPPPPPGSTQPPPRPRPPFRTSS